MFSDSAEGRQIGGGFARMLRLCRRLGRVDAARAMRLAASLRGPGECICGWAFVGLGLAENDQAAARVAIDRAIDAIDRLRKSGPAHEPGIVLNDIRVMYPTNPAALILPVVERIAPDRLADVYWRAVALHPQIEFEPEDVLERSYLGVECMLLARYDREVAANLFAQMDSYLQSLVRNKRNAGGSAPSAIVAKACLDPRAAVEILEALTPPRDLSQFRPSYAARVDLAAALGPPPVERWKSRWRQISAQLPLDD